MLGQMPAPELVPKLPSQLLSVIPVKTLANASITSLDQVTNKTWTLSQVMSLKTSTRAVLLYCFADFSMSFQCITLEDIYG